MSLAATRILDSVARNIDFSSNEARLGRWGALDFYIEETNTPGGAVTEEMQAIARQSIGTDYQIPVLQHNGTVQLLTTRSCDIPCNPLTSEMLNITFTTLGFGFCMNPDEHLHNYIPYEAAFDFNMRQGIQALGDRMDELAVARLEAYKTQVISNPLGYDFTGNTVSAPYAKRMDILSDVGIMMKSNRFNRTPLHIVGNSGTESLIAQGMRLGTYNSIDYAMEFANKRFHITENIDNAADQFATFFALEPGNVGILYQFPRVALAGRSLLEKSWDIVNLPMLNIPAAMQYTRGWSDLSSTEPDMTCDIVEKFGFYVTFAMVEKYNSAPATIATPNIKVQIADGGATAGNGIPVQITNVVQTTTTP